VTDKRGIMQTFKLDPVTHDLSITGSTIDIITEAVAWAQFLKQRVLLWKGEYFLDVSKGVDYDVILGGKKDPDQSEFMDVIEGAGANTKVTSFTMERGRDRILHVTFTATSDYGEVTVTI